MSQEKKKNITSAVLKTTPVLRKVLATWKMSTETGYFQTLLSKQQQTTLQWECHRAVPPLATGGQERAMLVSHSHWFWESPKTPWSFSSLSGTNEQKNLLLLPANFAKPENYTWEICSEEKVLVPKWRLMLDKRRITYLRTYGFTSFLMQPNYFLTCIYTPTYKTIYRDYNKIT